MKFSLQFASMAVPFNTSLKPS